VNIKGRKLVMAGLLAAASFITGCGGSEKQAKESGVINLPERQGRKVYFAFDDPRHDDDGTGRYRYPLSFDNREGFLDITRFTVEDGGSNVVFTISCRRPIEKYDTNGFTGPKGWWLQMLDIYIDKDGSEGRETGYLKALPGRQIEFEGKKGWEKVVLVTPNDSRIVEKILEDRTSDMELVHQRNDIVVPHRVYPQGFTFVVYVPKHEIGAPQPGWGYQVLMTPYDSSNLSYGHFQNSKIGKFASQDKFGGGTDFDGNPNVLDMLAPTAEEQHRILSNHYSAPYSGDNKFAQICFIYGEKSVSPFKAPVAVEQTHNYAPTAGGKVSEPEISPAEKYKLNTSSENQSPMPNNNLKIHSFEGGF
jgi:carbohydrate-binding DOMON domain-containing protein